MARTDGLVELRLTPDEAAELMAISTVGTGGWQSMIRRMQERLDPTGSRIELEDRDLAKVFRYMLYGGGPSGGTFQKKMTAIFARAIREKLPVVASA